jgi:PAS domain S-box-containing protein
MNTVLAGFCDYRLVVVSVIVAVLAAYAALDLAGRVTAAQGNSRLAWLCSSATAMGIGIWAVYYIGMAGFHLPIQVLYDWPTVVLSLFAAILASGLAFFTVSQPAVGFSRVIAGGGLMGGGIAATHYIGMESMRLPANFIYSPGLVLLSILLAIVISSFALQQAFHVPGTLTSGWRKLSCALLLGMAVSIMHYVGMAAVHYVLRSSITDYFVSVTSVGLASTTAVLLLILGLFFLRSRVDRRFSLQEQRFVDNRLQLHAIFDTMIEAIVVVDCDRGIVEHNRAASELLGLENRTISLREMSEAFEGLSPTREVLAPEDWPIVRAIHGNFCKNSEVIIRRKDTGATVTVEISTVPVDAQGKDSRQIIVSLRDIGERKRLDEERTRLVAIVASSEDAIIGKDAHGIVTSWNAGAEKVFGYKASEVIGQNIKRLLPADREREEDNILLRLEHGELIENFETIRRRKDGEFIHVSLTISPIRDPSGEVVGASKIARNITDTKRLESQLRQSQKMDAIGQLTGGIAHDFNNLLGIILGNLDLLELFAASNEIALDQVQTSQRAAARGADLTRRLLAFARMETLKPSSTLLNASIQNMIAMATRALGPEIRIAMHLDESLPRVFVDAAGLESALLNLVVNARDAMPGGGLIDISTRLTNLDGADSTVRIGEMKPGWYACACISDTGHGMSPQTLERVFEPFFTTKQRDKGTGLGLAMVYGFVKQSGGAVRIYSEVGHGTAVSMYLPLAEGGSEPAITAISESPSTKLNATVLIVDDETDLLRIAKAYLGEIGCIALQAIDGASALEIVKREENIHLMMTDIIMPGGMNGVELAKRVHELKPDIKIIYSSGFPADSLAAKEMSLVEGPLLRKPYQRAEFRAIVRSVLEGSHTKLE